MESAVFEMIFVWNFIGMFNYRVLFSLIRYGKVMIIQLIADIPLDLEWSQTKQINEKPYEFLKQMT